MHKWDPQEILQAVFAKYRKTFGYLTKLLRLLQNQAIVSSLKLWDRPRLATLCQDKVFQTYCRCRLHHSSPTYKWAILSIEVWCKGQLVCSGSLPHLSQTNHRVTSISTNSHLKPSKTLNCLIRQCSAGSLASSRSDQHCHQVDSFPEATLRIVSYNLRNLTLDRLEDWATFSLQDPTSSSAEEVAQATEEVIITSRSNLKEVF